MMDSPKKLSHGPMYFSYNLQNNGRSSKNLNLNYRADRHSYMTGKKSFDEQLRFHRCPICNELFPYKSFLSIHVSRTHKIYFKRQNTTYSKRSI